MIRLHTIGQALTASLVAYCLALPIWLVGGLAGHWRGGAVVAAWVALVGVGLVAWARWAEGILLRHLPSHINLAILPVGALAWAYMAPHQWAWVAMALWLASPIVACYIRWRNVRRLTLSRILAVMVVSQTLANRIDYLDVGILKFVQMLGTLAIAMFFIRAGMGASAGVLIFWLIIAGVISLSTLPLYDRLKRRQLGPDAHR